MLAPKRPQWLAWSAGIGIVLLGAFATAAWWSAWQPGRLGGLLAGSMAAALFVNAALYPWRRRWRAWPLGTAQAWLQLHIYGSTLAALLVLIHIGFRLPAGTFGWCLLGLTLWTTASGLLGVFLQKRLPALMATQLRVEPIYERIPALVSQLAAEADAAMTGASDAASRTFQAEIRPLLATPSPSWGFLTTGRAERERLLDPLTRIAAFVGEEDRARLAEVQSIARDKFDLDIHMSLQRALRLWPMTHVPPAMLLLGLLVVHILAVVYF